MPATKPKKNNKDATKGTDAIYQMVTDRIIAALEEGVVPWRKPWTAKGAHRNFASKRVYRGINQFMLDLVAQSNGYTSNEWITYKAMTERGGSLKKINGEDEKGTGQKATPVVFWKMLNLKTDEQDDNGNDVVKKIPMLRYYNVYNVEQTDLDVPVVEQPDNDFNPIEAAEAIYRDMKDAPPLSHGGDRAYYTPGLDSIRMPERESFVSVEDYYHTLWHEMVHATGHESRTGRIKDWSSFGSEPYAKEELVAEMGASMLTSWVGLDMPNKDNDAAYIGSWLKALKNDKKLVIGAASKAHQAMDYILGVEYSDNKKED